jgi:glycosyltransferase involved in cell wall biosynthesis
METTSTSAIANTPASNPPLVAIGLPIYNSAGHLAQSISSLLAQTFRDFVLIISDNASTDGTGEICQRFASQDPRIRYFRNPVNIGLTGNFNRVFELSESKYFKWATGDDFWAPDMLADAVAVLESDPSIVLCYPRTVIVDGEGREQGRFEDKLHLMQDDAVQRFLAVLDNIKLVNHHLGVLRSDAIRRTRLFGRHVSADTGFVAEMSLYGKFFEVKKYQFFRRFHADSSSWNRSDQEHQARRFHAANVRRVPFNNWLYHRAFCSAVLRSPLDFGKKFRLLGQLAKRMYWDSEWLYDDLRRDVPSLLGFRNGKSAAKK